MRRPGSPTQGPMHQCNSTPASSAPRDRPPRVTCRGRRRPTWHLARTATSAASTRSCGVHSGWSPRARQEHTMLSYDEAIARVTGPGERFETTQVDIRDVTYTVFRNAPRSLRDIVATTHGRGDGIFLVYEDERWTFTEFAAKVDALAGALVDRYRISKGDRVAIGMRNYPEWVVAFSAITSIGAVSVSLNAWWTSDELGYGLDDCGASVLIADAERVERSAETCKRLGIDVIAVRAPKAGPGVDQWDDVVRAGGPMPDVEVDPDDDATILYTSGTTGHPKGAVSTH